MFVEIYYSQVPNKQISLIGEYHEYYLIMVNQYHVMKEYIEEKLMIYVNEYDLINEYQGQILRK